MAAFCFAFLVLELNAKTCSSELLRIGVGVLFGLDAGAGDEPAKRFFPAGAALRSGDEAVAINYDIDGIFVGLIHGREIGVLHHHDFAVAGMLLEVFLDGFPGFADVNGEKDEALGREFFADFVHEGGFIGAEAAPGGPEFEQNDFEDSTNRGRGIAEQEPRIGHRNAARRPWPTARVSGSSIRTGCVLKRAPEVAEETCGDG